MRLEEQIYFSSRDLENLSSSVLYSFDPSQPFKTSGISFSSVPRITLPDFSPKVSYIEEYKKQQDELAETLRKVREAEERKKREEERRQEELNRLLKSEPLSIKSNQKGIKLFGEEIQTPLIRFDYSADLNGSKPAKHLHYGTDYLGRNGNEAVDILCQLITLTKRPLFSGGSTENEDES